MLMRTNTILLYSLSGFVFWISPAYSQSNSQSSLALVLESEFFVDLPSMATVTRLPVPKAETPVAVTADL